MKKNIVAGLALLFALVLCTAAGADTVYMDGVAKAVNTETILAPIGGTVKTIEVREGDTVKAGAALLALQTTVVYADEPGYVAFYGRPGERTEAVADLYGAVAVIDPDSRYMISTSITNAYDSNENKMVKSGIQVFLQRTDDTIKKSGIGQVYDVEGRNYKVRVLEGNFELGDTVNIYQTPTYDYTTRIGRGDVERTDSIKYTGEGSIVSLFVDAGAHVEKGDPLFETLDGTFNGLISTGNIISATMDGVVSEIVVSHGDHIENNQVVAELWPMDSLRVMASIHEMDLADIEVGDMVELEFDAFSGQWIPGTIEKISFRAISDDEASKNAEYEAVISFETELPIRFGMHTQVRTMAK